MSNYPGLKLGNVLPATGILQRLLVRAGHRVTIDGEFGSGTKHALQEFQRSFGMTATGKTDPLTWERLVAGESLPILDVVDVFDPSLYNMEVSDLRGLGSDPIMIGGMCNGVEQAINMICAYRGLFMLRFHGHGAPGNAGVSDGQGNLGQDYSSIDIIDMAYLAPIVSRLRGCFGSFGCIQFMHCNSAYGTKGNRLLRAVADATGVPVSAGIDTQYAGGAKTFFFEGPTKTSIPGGSSIRSWSMARPPFMTAPASSV
jgi:Putative peptidoglycan binding domain